MDRTPAYSAFTRRRRAVAAVITMVMTMVLVGFAALTVDVGYMYNLATDMQNSADAAALAGASALKDSQYDAYEARALAIVAKHHETQGSFALDDQIIEMGRWDKALQTFTILPPEQANSANAIRVVAMRIEAALFFAAVMGVETTNVSREAIAMVSPSCNGIWGLNGIDVPGSVSIDSYDSTAGAYSAGSAEHNGDVCSNGDIRVYGSADIHGDVLSTSGDVTLVGGAAFVSGVTEAQLDLVGAPTIDFGDIATNNDNGTIGLTDFGNDPLDNTSISVPGSWDLILGSGENLTLAPGTYYFDDIIMAGSSSLTLTGRTTIYLEDDIVMVGSASLNMSQNPADLTIICNGDSDGSTLELSGNTEFYGTILAPTSTVKLSGNSDFYGTVIADIVDFNGNFSFHVDESLDWVNGLKGPLVLVR